MYVQNFTLLDECHTDTIEYEQSNDVWMHIRYHWQEQCVYREWGCDCTKEAEDK